MTPGTTEGVTTVFALAEHGTTFSTRPRGVELKAAVDARLDERESVALDFSGVLNVSSSFADEFVGEIGQERPVMIRGANPEVERVVARVLARRGFEPAP